MVRARVQTCGQRIAEMARYRALFVGGAEEDELNSLGIDVRPEVLASWRRLRALGVDPLEVNSRSRVDSETYSLKAAANRRLIDVAGPVFDRFLQIDSHGYSLLGALTVDGVGLVSMMKGSGFFEEVRSLGMLSESEYEAVAGSHEVLVETGSLMDEQTMGTSSHLLCAETMKPIQLVSSDHYSESVAAMKFLATSFPLFEIDGSVRAILAHLQFLDDSLLNTSLAACQLASLRFIGAVASAVESEIKFCEHAHAFVPPDNESPDYGLIVADNQGVITSISHTAYRLLGLPRGAGTSTIETLFSDQPHLIGLIRNGGRGTARCRLLGGTADLVVQIESHTAESSFAGGSILVRLMGDAIALPSGAASASKTSGTSLGHIIGSSDVLEKTKRICRQFSGTSENVLLLGQSGTGKELFARAIHNEARPHTPFVVWNSAVIPKEMMTSELLGYEAGVFSGARSAGRAGKIEQADGGTLFLDEVGDIPLSLQSALVRILDDRQVTRIGAVNARSVDFRVLAATSKNLEDLVRRGLFHADLYYRLAVLTIRIPPLRERREDIDLLCCHFLTEYCLRKSLPIPAVGATFIQRLREYDWPGNVRQLQNTVAYSANIATIEGSQMILPRHLPDYVANHPGALVPQQPEAEDSPFDTGLNLEQLELQALRKASELANGDTARMAAMLGISPSTVYRKMKLYRQRGA